MKLLNLDDISSEAVLKEKTELAHYMMLQALKIPFLLIDNVQTEIRAAVVDGSILSVTVNEIAYNTSYVCSMYTAFISYAKQELKKINNLLIQKILLMLISSLDNLLKKVHIDRVVSNNNFLLSTNLYFNTTWKEGELRQYLQGLIKEFPEHTIIFRSLNFHTNKDLIQVLKNIGCKLVPSRQVYIFDQSLKDYTKQKNYQIDLKLLNNIRDYTLCYNADIMHSDYKQIEHLYKKLYIDKYSTYNPIFNAQYIEYSHKTSFIEYFGLRNKEGVLDAIIGCYDRNNTTTAPIVGYDTDLSQKLGLYRILMAYCINRAQRKGMVLNLSSGASLFKILRGGVPFIEYSAVYTNHLNNRLQKLTWKLLGNILIYIGVPIMKYFKL
ncbi:MAG: hypothetical protein QWI36_00790 [Wolbachia endosymbiont of Tyrophagus putrescentiae]|nr:hypothetical protein [Wolbachia endosymbiont of Tyrophagus putrescentiae]